MSALALFIVPIIIFAVVIVIMAIYRSVYRNNMNKALEGEGSPGMMDLGQFIKMLVFIGLIVMNVVALSKISSLENQLYSVQTNLSSINTSLRNDIYSLNRQINEYFAEQALVQEFDYVLEDIDGTDVLYHFEFTLSELDPDATVYMLIDGDTDEKVEISSSTLTFETDIILQSSEQYTINLLIEGDFLIQEELLELDVEEMLVQSVSAHIYPDFWEEETDENYKDKLQAQVVNLLSHIDSKRIDSVDFDIFYEGELILEETLTTPTTVTDDMEVFKMYEDNVEAFVFVFEDNDYRWSELVAHCTITLMDGTVIILDAYL